MVGFIPFIIPIPLPKFGHGGESSPTLHSADGPIDIRHTHDKEGDHVVTTLHGEDGDHVLVASQHDAQSLPTAFVRGPDGQQTTLSPEAAQQAYDAGLFIIKNYKNKDEAYDISPKIDLLDEMLIPTPAPLSPAEPESPGTQR